MFIMLHVIAPCISTHILFTGGVSWYKYLIVSLVFSHLGFWSGNCYDLA